MCERARERESERERERERERIQRFPTDPENTWGEKKLYSSYSLLPGFQKITLNRGLLYTDNMHAVLLSFCIGPETAEPPRQLPFFGEGGDYAGSMVCYV